MMNPLSAQPYKSMVRRRSPRGPSDQEMDMTTTRRGLMAMAPLLGLAARPAWAGTAEWGIATSMSENGRFLYFLKVRGGWNLATSLRA